MLAVAWLPWIRLPDAWAEVPSESAKAEIINKTAVLRFTIILLGLPAPRWTPSDYSSRERTEGWRRRPAIHRCVMAITRCSDVRLQAVEGSAAF
jgi:hypothetical protein